MSGRLRAPPLSPPLHVVLVEPEIPQNTGNIARLCAATASPLHLVGPLGFRIDDKAVRRAGLDYWHLVEVHRHVTLSHFQHSCPGSALFLLSAHSPRSYLEAPIKPGDAIVFGRESVGLPKELLETYADRVYAVPTMGGVRSLNLANSVSIVLFDALRRLGVMDHTFTD